MPATPPVLERVPGGYQLLAAGAAVRRGLGEAWRGSRLNDWRLSRPAPEGLRASPKDLRPASRENGARILAGGFLFAGETLASGVRGDPWDRPCPSRRFAEALHGFSWLKDLALAGEPGAWEGLRLTLAWRRLFRRWSAFAWDPVVLERRVFNLACNIGAISQPASDAEAAEIASDLARQARFLLEADAGPARAAERAAAAAVAGAALGGVAGEVLLERAMARLDRALAKTVTLEGGHATRSPQAALELYFDLATLEEALAQIGAGSSVVLAGARARLARGLSFFTLADGRLAGFQGGDALSEAYVAAAGIAERTGGQPPDSVCDGYVRLQCADLQLVVDAGPPAAGPWSCAACAQPLALEVLAHGKRLIVNSGWSPQAHAPQALRLADAASTLSLPEAPCGEPLAGFPARALGPRLRDPPAAREVRRHENFEGLWLELEHDGWLKSLGLLHERRLFLDRGAEGLRGDDRLVCIAPRKELDARRLVPFTVRFHLAPQVSALIARDRRGALIRAEGEETAWRLRTDALDVILEPSVQYADGIARHGEQIVLRAQARLGGGGRIRWKLEPAHYAALGARSVTRVDVGQVTA
jgi:uncharacterized heparinase superfamily protein